MGRAQLCFFCKDKEFLKYFCLEPVNFIFNQQKLLSFEPNIWSNTYLPHITYESD